MLVPLFRWGPSHTLSFTIHSVMYAQVRLEFVRDGGRNPLPKIACKMRENFQEKITQQRAWLSFYTCSRFERSMGFVNE